MSPKLRSAYQEDIARMAVRKMRELPATVDSIRIVQRLQDTIGKALAAVHNAPLPVADSMFGYYGIHTFPRPATHKLKLRIDSAKSWIQPVKKGDKAVGHPAVDSLMQQYNLTVKWVQRLTNYNITLSADKHLNLNPLAAKMDALDVVNSAKTFSLAGDGNDIRYRTFPGYQQLDFHLKWGDCPSGCIHEKVHHFKIYEDCRISHSTSGEPLPQANYRGYQDSGNSTALFTPDRNDSFVRLYPNPTGNEFKLVALKGVGRTKITIMTSRGTIIQQRVEDFPQEGTTKEFDLITHPSGIYFILLITREKQQLSKVIKK